MMADLFSDFFIRALVAACGVALVAGPLGCVVVWRRMAYFGDTIAHAALLGVGLGFFFQISLLLGVVIVALTVAIALSILQTRQQLLAIDTLLGILSHATLASGLVLLSLIDAPGFDLGGYLFGDILAVSTLDIALIWGMGLVLTGGLFWLWRDLIAVTVDPDLAAAEGIDTLRVRLAYILMLALMIALAMKVVGVLLITSLLIIPAAAARRFVRSPEAMAAVAALLGVCASLAGLHASLHFDTPSGPSIVVAAFVFFLLSLIPARLVRRT